MTTPPTTGGTLEMLTIVHETVLPAVYDGAIPCLFNPASLKFSKEASWGIDTVPSFFIANYQRATFQQSKPRTLAIELFFDTYEGPPASSAGGSLRSAIAATQTRQSGVDVTTYTTPVEHLALVQIEFHRPPRCQVWWGRRCLLRGVLTSVSTEYTMFLANGTPVRANLSCTFTEAISLRDGIIGELHSADVVKQRILRGGETLSAIAQEVYNDASRWRLIAEANRISNPRDLRAFIGLPLVIPTLPTRHAGPDRQGGQGGQG